MHGVSHQSPDDMPPPPPPMHHGVRQLIGQHPLAYTSRHASMESIGYNMTQNMELVHGQTNSSVSRPPPPPVKANSSASSLIDLSQSQIRLSPLERTTSHISLNMMAPRQTQGSAAGSHVSQTGSQLSRHVSHMARSSPVSVKPKMTRSQSHLSSGSGLSHGHSHGQRLQDPLNLGHVNGAEHLDRFLASVEKINAETEARLSDEYQSSSDHQQPPAQPSPGARTVNLRRGRTISNRWHSMESLDSNRSQTGARSSRLDQSGASSGRMNQSGSSSKLGPNQHSIPVEVHRPKSRDSFGPRGFSSMVSLNNNGFDPPRATSSPIGPPLPARNRSVVERRPVTKTTSLDSMSVRSGCSCDTDATNNTVMDITKDEAREDTIPRPVMSDSKRTKIEYLGSVPIDSKATDLSNLQVPMKNLYFKSIEMKNMGHQQLPGTMEISETGLKVNYIRELHKGVQEIFNPFPTIAVWAAVKFVVKKEHNANGDIVHKFAFLPLIADPDDGGKTDLFYPLSSSEADIATGPSHPALFAAVMRKAGVAKQLECHGFVCDSPEEAIMVAANLYQALLETMKRNKRAGSQSQVSKSLLSCVMLLRSMEGISYDV